LNGNRASAFRYKAASAAALAGCGLGVGAPLDDEKECARLRRQALDWLRAELAVWRGLLDKAPVVRCLAVAKHLNSWRQDASFDGVRDTKALARLPAAERADWQNLWQEIEDVRQAALAAAKVGASPGS